MDKKQESELIAKLIAENEALKAKVAKRQTITLKVSEKGCMSAYGFGRNLDNERVFGGEKGEMRCLECKLEITSLDHLSEVEEDQIRNRRNMGKKDPQWSFHKWCDRPRKPICAGHVTPPGLEELEKGYKGKW